MKHALFCRMVLTAILVAALPSFATTKTVTWSLPADWADEVAYPEVQGYRAIAGKDLLSRLGVGEVAEPDLPYCRIRVALPSNGTFGEVMAEVEWEKVDLGGVLPLPIAQPVPTGNEVVYPKPGKAYQSVYPADVAKAEHLQIMSDVRMMPIVVTPFKWDGPTKTLYRAKTLTVTATFDVPNARRLALASATSQTSQSTNRGIDESNNSSFRQMALDMTVNPEDATTASSGIKLMSTASARENLASYGTDSASDYVIISPHKFVDLWTEFAEFRETTENGKSLTFCVVDADAIYRKFDTVDGDDALKIHRYIEELYALSPRKIKYVVLGAAAKKYKYDNQTMIPARYVVCGGSLSQLLDMYYGCMDRLPTGTGVEVWDYDGDGTYLGHKNANGSYSGDSNAYIDWAQDLAVFRFPLMEEVVEAGIKVTAGEIMTNFIAKIRRVESDSYPDRYSAILTGSTGFSTSWRGGASRVEMYGLITDEREFFDQGTNIFDPAHPTGASDSEYLPRDHNWEFLTSLRGNRKVLMNNSSYSTCSYNDIYKTSGDFLDTICHGWARGAVGAVNSDGSFQATGIYTIYDCAVPCDTGMFDYCPSGSYGITNCICVGEAPILAPNGGALASINNTRYGWSASWTTSYGLHEKGMAGQHSGQLSWLFMEALSGMTSWNNGQGYQPMDAGTALMYAHNQHGTPYASAAWGLSGAQVTGQGDPLARLAVQHSRMWEPEGDSKLWSTNAANWRVAGLNAKQVFDVSREVLLPLTGKGDTTFDVDGAFTAAALYVGQDEGATLTIDNTNGSFKVYRETIITNGNLCWKAAGGFGRYGIKFAGAKSGNITLPGNAKRYFGEKFLNVGKISVSGGNVTIDTPRNATFDAALAYDEIEFVATNAADVTEWNILRSRNPGIFKTKPEKHLPIVNSKLILQTYNIGGSGSGNAGKPLIFATNSTIKVQANPLWKEEYFVRPTYLHDSTLVGDYDKFAFGPSDNKGYDLYVSGKCTIAGDTPIKLNGDLRVHFLGADAELEIANPLCDGGEGAAGSLKFFGHGKVKVSATQTFTGAMEISDGVTLEGAIAKITTGEIVVKNGATATFAVIPLAGVTDLTLENGSIVNLPGETANGLYQIVDVAATTLVDDGATYYDCSTIPAEKILGDISEGYLLKTANILFWKGVDGVWDATDTTVWTNASGAAATYADGVPLCFPDGAANQITVTLGMDVKPGFMVFRNVGSRYVFGGSHAIALDALAVGSGVTFDAPLEVTKSFKVTAGGDVTVGSVRAPSIEIADKGRLHIAGEMSIPAQKVKKLKFSFSAAKDAGNVVAVQELRLFNGSGFFYLPKDTVITDIAGQSVTITGSNGEYGHTMKGHTEDEQLGALVDGKITDKNKWWAHQSGMPTWFEITFPEPVDAIVGYDFFTADYASRNPKSWSVYTAAEDGIYTLAQTKSDIVDETAHHWMIGDGTAQGGLYPLVSISGLATVHSGGTLVLCGDTHLGLSLEADAVLAVNGKSCLTNRQPLLAELALPGTGVVKIDLSEASDTGKKFPILVGFNLTKEDLAKFECTTDEGMLVVKDGDLYAAPKSELPPYCATLTGDAKWSELSWCNANNVPFDWKDANRRANAEIRLTVSDTATLDIDVGDTIGTLVILGDGTLTVTTSVADALTPSGIDDSGHTGLLDWRIPTGSAFVTAGADTRIHSGADGKGLLTVGEGKKVTLGEGVEFSNLKIDANGWVRFEGERTEFELAKYTAANYSFEDGELVGDFRLDGHTIMSADGDNVRLVGNEGNFYARSLLNFDITGGVVEYETNGDTTWFGWTATPGTNTATIFRQSGGVFRCLATGTGTGGGLLTGYEGGTEVGSEFHIDLTGGRFEIPNSYLDFGNPTVVTMLNDAHLMAKGVIASMSPGTIYLGSTNAASSVVLELGSLGLQAGAADITMYNGATVLGCEDGAFIEGGILLYPKKWSSTEEMTFAATNSATLTLHNLKFTYFTPEGAIKPLNENMLVKFGAANYEGTVIVDSASCLPTRWKLMGGTMSFGSVRLATGSTMTAAPVDGSTISFVLTDDECDTGMAIELIKTDGWSDGYTSDNLKKIFKVFAYEGGELAEVGGTLSSSGGIVTYIPAGGESEYVYPLTATVTSNSTWSALTWTDRNGKSYGGDWQNVAAAQLVNKTGNYTVTMDRPVSLRTLNTQTGSGRTLTIADSGSNKLTVKNRFNDSASAGTTIPKFSLDGNFAVHAGKGLRLDCSNAVNAVHGTLVIGGGCLATIYDGAWNGMVEMADATATIQYKRTGDEVYDFVPGSIGPSNPGITEYYVPMTPSDGVAQFGSDTARAAAGTFYFYSGADITASRFVTGIGNGTVQTFFQRSNITIDGDQDEHVAESSFVLGDDDGSKTTYYLMGGNIICTNAPLVLGKGGSANVTFRSTPSVYNLKGVTTAGHDNGSTFTVSHNAKLDIGSGGIDIVSSIHQKDVRYYPFNLQGTVRSAVDTTLNIPDGIGIEKAQFAPFTNTVMTVNAPIYNAYQYEGELGIEGEGRVDLNDECMITGDVTLRAGTLRLQKFGLLNSSMVVFSGGRLEVMLTMEQVRAKIGNTYALFGTKDTAENAQAYTTVLVQETGNIVEGIWKKTGDVLYFTPKSSGDISGVIAADGTYAWTDIAWRDKNGAVAPQDWQGVVGNVILTNQYVSTLNIADTISLSVLRLYNSGTLTINGPFAADTVDDSRSTGRTVIGEQGVFGAVKAGADTVLNASGTDMLTIEKGKKATSRVCYTGGIENEGTYVYDYPMASLPAHSDDRRYTGGGTSGETSYSSGTLNLAGGEFAYSGKFALLTASANVSGDTRVTTPRFVLGDGYNAHSTYTQNGGVFEVTGSTPPTSNKSSILLAHWYSDVTMNLAGGTFIATNAVTRLGWDGSPTVTVGGAATQAVMHVKGIVSGDCSHDKTASFILKDNGVLELGDGGLQACGSAATYNLKGGRITAFESCSVYSATDGKMTLGGTVTLAAANGKTLTVDAKLGEGTVICGAEGLNGQVLFTNGKYAETTITGRFAMRLSPVQLASDVAVVLCRTTNADLSDIDVQMTDGTPVPGTVSIQDGALVWTPPVCKLPLRATADGSAQWSDLVWTDSSEPANLIPAAYWTYMKEVSVDVTVNAGAELTMPDASKLPDSVSVRGEGMVVVNGAWPTYGGLTNAAVWKGTLKLVNKTGCAGQNFVYLGNAESTVEVDNVTGYFAQSPVSAANPYGVCYPYTLKVSGSGITINDGSSSRGFGFARVTGSGPISFGKAGGAPRMRLVLEDAEDYTGALTVVGDAAVMVGAPTGLVDNGKIVIEDGTVARGKTWTASKGVEVTGTLTMTPNEVKPFGSAVTFKSGSTLNVAQDEDVCESVPITTGALTMDLQQTVLTFNGVVSKGEWTVAAGYLVKTVELTATAEGTVLDAHHTDKIVKATGTKNGFFVVNSSIGPTAFKSVAGDPVVLKFGGEGLLTIAGGLDATLASVKIDVGGMDGTNVAKYAVSGAPYSRWLVKGAVTGTVSVVNLPLVPTGYKVASEVLPDYGVRLIVTANTAARLGVVSLNLHNGATLSGEGDHGLYPDALANWGNLQATANGSTSVSNATFTIGNNASGYNINTYADAIYQRYLDDSKGVMRTISISSIPFDKYRVIVYYSTDTLNYQFQPLIVNDGTEDQYYAGETQLVNEKNFTIKGCSATWGHSGPDKGMNAINEGVNLLVTDVYTNKDLTLKFYRNGDARATPCAIQIVKVGDIYTGPLEYEEKQLATTLDFVLPGTVTTQSFQHVKSAAHDWSTVEIWQRKTGAIETNYTAVSGYVPGVTGGSNNIGYAPLVYDGVTTTVDKLEGWWARYGFYNGAKVTVGEQNKFQRGNNPGIGMFVAVDATSQFVISGWGGASYDAFVDFCVAAPSGIVCKTKYAKSTAINYYLTGMGSVVYEQGFTGTHNLKNATIELGDVALTGRAVTNKYLIVGGTVASDGLVVDGGMRKPSDAELTKDDAVGTYRIGSDTTGTYIEWVARASGTVVVDPSQSGGVIPATRTNDVKIVTTWTNGEDEVKLDLTSAYTLTKVEGGVKAELNPAGKVVVDGETIYVRPELSEAEGEEEIKPLVVGGDVAVGVKTIPGLTYYLMRGSVLGSYPDNPASERATGPRTQLTDKNKPDDRAFYIIRVNR